MRNLSVSQYDGNGYKLTDEEYIRKVRSLQKKEISRRLLKLDKGNRLQSDVEDWLLDQYTKADLSIGKPTRGSQLPRFMRHRLASKAYGKDVVTRQ